MVRRATQSSRAADSLLVMFAAIAAVLFLVSFAGTAMATESTKVSGDTLYGKISAVDASHPTQSLTLQSVANGEPIFNVFADENTSVKMCDEHKSFKDIKVGSNAQITFYELAGLTVADFIYVPC